MFDFLVIMLYNEHIKNWDKVDLSGRSALEVFI